MKAGRPAGSEKVVRMAFNLYCNGTPSVLDYDDAEKQVDECRNVHSGGTVLLCPMHLGHSRRYRYGIRIRNV